MDIKSLLNEQPTMKRSCKVYTCTWTECCKNFKRRSDLIRHKRIHTGERPYHCDWFGCQKTFIQRSALTVHLRTHTGEKPHICEYENCQKSFGDSSSLARHRKTHSGSRPFVCTCCSKSFTRKTTLVRHQNQIHNRLPFNPVPMLTSSPVSVFSEIEDKPLHYDCPATPPVNYIDLSAKMTTCYLPPIHVYNPFEDKPYSSLPFTKKQLSFTSSF